jgi:hypothetical protein
VFGSNSDRQQSGIVDRARQRATHHMMGGANAAATGFHRDVRPQGAKAQNRDTTTEGVA